MVIGRLAPSPTGAQHVGNARTFLLAWLSLRSQKGRVLLRIEDIDSPRVKRGAAEQALDDLRWLGIDWDEGPEAGGPHAPYYQSQRLPGYQAAVEKLLAGGFAYRDFATPEELQVERELAQQEKRPFLYSRKWMAETPAAAERFEREGRAGVVRLRMPREGTLRLKDHIRGEVDFQWAREQDHVIQRADGTCLYHLASVVDDFDFQISHVIRAEEHLSNTPRQVFIAQSLGYPLPEYAHLPYVAEPGSKNKLSKRKLDKYLKNRDFALVNEHGLAIAQAMGLTTSAETFNPVIVDFYEQVGYLPDAIVNYLMLLGWSLDDKTEFFSRQQMIDNFSLERVTKAPASFDPKKLWAFQDHYMQQLPLAEKVERTLPFLLRAGLIREPVTAEVRPKLSRILQAAGDRIKVAGDVLAYADFFFTDNFSYEADALEKRLGKPEAAELVAKFRERLLTVEPYNVETLEVAMHAFLAAENIKIGDIIHGLRVAVTGKSVGPGIYDCLAILGREACIARLDRTLERVRA
ncbi:MAG TPA: glutamate--tRNA ligase family protein [Pirellulales bacterium]|nr:glutamate--tRNA ligase family protein [Pirellulales bacterium]